MPPLLRFSMGVLPFAATSVSVGSAPPPAIVWQTAFEKAHCTISTGNPNVLGVSISAVPGDPQAELYLVGPANALPREFDKAKVQLTPTGETFEAEGYLQSSGDPAVAKLVKLQPNFAAAFAGSSEMRVSAGRKQLTARVPGAAGAVAALNECIDRKLAEWGVDAQAYHALLMPPTEIPGYNTFKESDYPGKLLDAGWEGDAVARFKVDATGKVTGCTIVVSSGQKAIDDVTCSRSLQRGRFNPAIGADGRPTTAERIKDVVFKIAR